MSKTAEALLGIENGDTKIVTGTVLLPSESRYVEANLWVSSDDYSTIESMAEEIGITTNLLAATALRFYYPLLRLVKEEGYLIQQGVNLRHLVPYTLPSDLPGPWEEAARFHLLSPEARIEEKNKRNGDANAITLTLSQEAWVHLRETVPDVGQLVLDGIECYNHLRESWMNGNRIFLEKEDLVEKEIDMEVFESSPANT